MSFNIIIMIQLSRQVYIITIGPTHNNTDQIMKVTAMRKVMMKTMVMKNKTILPRMRMLRRMLRKMLRRKMLMMMMRTMAKTMAKRNTMKRRMRITEET
jgi:hypothetical protein